MVVPEWFLKELKIIDQTWKVQEPEDHIGLFIIKDIDLTIKADDGKSLSLPGKDLKRLRVRGPLVVLWIPEANNQALDQLRKMKLEAAQMRIFDNPLKELFFWQKKKREAKKKREELAVDMISEGLMEQYKLERKKSWSYGGEKTQEER